MPWSKENPPEAVKYLHPRVKAKAIAIANAILRNGGKDGVAIATGIKKAKENFDKTAIEGGAYSNLPNALENSAQLNAHANIPLAKGLPKPKSLIKMAMNKCSR